MLEICGFPTLLTHHAIAWYSQPVWSVWARSFKCFGSEANYVVQQWTPMILICRCKCSWTFKDIFNSHEIISQMCWSNLVDSIMAQKRKKSAETFQLVQYPVEVSTSSNCVHYSYWIVGKMIVSWGKWPLLQDNFSYTCNFSGRIG